MVVEDSSEKSTKKRILKIEREEIKIRKISIWIQE